MVQSEASRGPESLTVARLLNELGVACKFAGLFDEAEVHYQRALNLVELHKRLESDDAANLMHNLGGLAHSRRRFADGAGVARRGLALRRRLHGPRGQMVAADASALAALLEGTGDYAEAERLYTMALVIFEAIGDGYETAMTLNGLGSVCQALDRYGEAEGHYRRAIEVFEAEVPPGHPDLAHILNNLATLHRRRGEDPEARALLARAHDLLLRTIGADHPVTQEVAGNKQRVDSGPSPYV